MKKGRKVIKLEFAPGTCAICNANDNELKSIEHNHVFNHSVENYRDMLMKCFNIQLINSEDQTKDVEICGSCVSSLRSAASFRQLVEAADMTSDKNIPLLRNGKSARKSSEHPKNLSDSKTKKKSRGTKRNKKVLQLTEKLTDNTDWSRLGDSDEVHVKLEPSYQFQVKLEQSDQFKVKLEPNEQLKVKLESNDAEFHDNLSNFSNQPLSKLEDSNSVDIYDIFDGREQVTDGESSTTSAQMRIATGYEREIEQSKKRKQLIIPSLDISCTTCPICDKKFEARRLLSAHYDNHFPSFMCEICGLSYSKRRSYYQHKKRHSIDTHICTLCSRSFLSSSSLSAHIRTHHNKVKGMGCYKCDARFSNSVCRRKHMSLKHGIKCTMYPCPISLCEKTFYCSFKLNTHIKRTHDNIKSCFCTVCDKGFYGKQELKEHTLSHTDADRHKCDQCGKGFPRLRSLTEHLKIHNNIKDYVCEVCDKAFVQKSALKTHLKIHTKISS